MPKPIPGLADFDWLAASGLSIFPDANSGRQSLLPKYESHNRGRPSGRITRHSRDIIEKAMSEGITPLEAMLTLMREHWQRAREIHEDKGFDAAGYQYGCAGMWAEKAAPYFHPKLASIDMSTTVTITHEAALDMLE